MLHPIRSAYFDYKRYPETDYHGLGDLERALDSLMTKLCKLGIGHHFLDETILAKHGRVEGNKLVVGNCSYEYIILPMIYTMDKSTEELLRKFVFNGGKILLTHKKPTFLEGKRYNYNYLRSNVTLDEIIENEPVILESDGDVRITYRRDGEGRDFIYCVNLGKESTASFKFKGYTSFECYDIFTDTWSVIPTTVHFDEGQSYLLYPSTKEASPKKALKDLYLNKRVDVSGTVNNYITLDTLSYSFDNESYTEPRYHMCAFSELLDKRYNGELFLKYTVTVKELPSKCQLLCENTRIKEVFVNGKKSPDFSPSSFEICQLSCDICNMLKVGENEIVIHMDFYQGENVYYALFGENVTESLKNCLAYDTDIEPIYLMGDFGVYGDIQNHQREDILLGENFYLGKQKSSVECLISDGFPFFSGNITLTEKITLDNTDYQLNLPKELLVVDVEVNGKCGGRMMFTRKLDISDLLKVGENEIILTVTVGLRNLLGPFHSTEGEPGFVGPDTFERFGSWQDGKSKFYNEKYAFKKGII